MSEIMFSGGGANPYTLGFQKHQFDAHNNDIALWGSQETVLDALQSPPAAGITAEASPGILFEENTNPPLGTIGNPGLMVDSGAGWDGYVENPGIGT